MLHIYTIYIYIHIERELYITVGCVNHRRIPLFGSPCGSLPGSGKRRLLTGAMPARVPVYHNIISYDIVYYVTV